MAGKEFPLHRAASNGRARLRVFPRECGGGDDGARGDERDGDGDSDGGDGAARRFDVHFWSRAGDVDVRGGPFNDSELSGATEYILEVPSRDDVAGKVCPLNHSK